MWELFSLGRMPYTGMHANESLFLKIQNGYRLEKPEYSTTLLFDIMQSCWNKEPKLRPLFNELEDRLAHLLHVNVKNVSD